MNAVGSPPRAWTRRSTSHSAALYRGPIGSNSLHSTRTRWVVDGYRWSEARSMTAMRPGSWTDCMSDTTKTLSEWLGSQEGDAASHSDSVEDRAFGGRFGARAKAPTDRLNPRWGRRRLRPTSAKDRFHRSIPFLAVGQVVVAQGRRSTRPSAGACRASDRWRPSIARHQSASLSEEAMVVVVAAPLGNDL